MPANPLLKFFFLFSFITVSLNMNAQHMSIHGTARDTSDAVPLSNAVVIAVRLNDSLLVSFTRSDAKGNFRLDSLPVDTYQMVISHPRFGDQTILLLGSRENSDIDLKKVTLPPKSITLNEVTVFGYADPVYYKGDTLVYTADSFKVKQNAVVEDLLKKLPGIKVDADGKIYSQGKAVDQVLVDGDEFFGTDPTVATKNLAASSVESVQVYDKKNENASESDDKETLKVMDLKLKDDAKKGYFGKVSGASDFQKYYEGELLANKFKGKKKVSVFSLLTNTPRSRFDWGDVWKYGMNADMNTEYSDDGMMYTYRNDEDNTGIPRTLKSGFYYTDQWSKKTKVSLNYTYNNGLLNSSSEISNQYFLPDTSYKEKITKSSHRLAESHAPNLSITQSIDSLTDLEITSKLKYNIGTQNSDEHDSLRTNADSLTRTTFISPSTTTKNYDWNNTAKLTHKFRKKDRKLVANYSLALSNYNAKGFLISEDSSLPAITDQEKSSLSDNQSHSGSLTYTEPLSKRIKLEISYDATLSKGRQDKKTFDKTNGTYSELNDTLTNSFETMRTINRGGVKLSYEVKKYAIFMGARARQVYANNHNLVSGQEISQTVNNILPYLTYRYKFSDNKQVTLKYNTNSAQPSLNQLQPVPDNSNPNYIVKGNPDLLPTYSHTFSMDFWSWALLSGRNIWTSLGYTTTQHSFANDISYDSIGRTISRPVNTNGEYYFYGYMGMGLPVLSKVIEFNPNLNFNYGNSVNYINGQKNETKNFTPNGELDIKVETDTIEFHLGGGISYNSSSSSLNTKSDQSYYNTFYNASLEFTFPGKFRLETDAKYTKNYGREDIYNLDYLIWNASLAKTLLKNENLILSMSVDDVLNQNINTSRNVQDNVVSDVKTQLVGRYFLFKIQFKFNSNKEKGQDEN
jgi:hypothetical protein